MSNKNWEERSLESEIAFSKALLSEPVEYPDFIHLHNPYVPWGGDFNRAVRVKLTEEESFDRISAQVECIHQEKGLDRPDRFDIQPPALDESLWQTALACKSYRLITAVFFNAPAEQTDLPEGYRLYAPSQAEYFAWYRRLAEKGGYAAENWFELNLPLKANFIKVFKPYWLLKGDDRVGWVYAANLGEYYRLFEVEIEGQYQGQGMGRILLQAIRRVGYQQGVEYILLQTGRALRPFYEKCGFKECSTNSIVRLVK